MAKSAKPDVATGGYFQLAITGYFQMAIDSLARVRAARRPGLWPENWRLGRSCTSVGSCKAEAVDADCLRISQIRRRSERIIFRSESSASFAAMDLGTTASDLVFRMALGRR